MDIIIGSHTELVAALKRILEAPPSDRDLLAKYLDSYIHSLSSALPESEIPYRIKKLALEGNTKEALNLLNSLSDSPEPVYDNPWLEDDIFHDFVASAREHIDSIESLALDAENGDSEALRILRGHVHTLKGESGALELTEMQEVCHNLEDIIDQSENPTLLTDTILEVTSWLRTALEHYIRHHYPPPPLL